MTIRQHYGDVSIKETLKREGERKITVDGGLENTITITKDINHYLMIISNKTNVLQFS
jgi:hypothetical protein